MNDDEIKGAMVTAAVEVAKEGAMEFYKDGAKGAVVEAGGALKTLVGFVNNVVFHPIAKANLHFKYNLIAFERDLKEKIDKIPEGKVVEPPLVIAGPTVEALKYTFDTKELREMYLNLLSTAMNEDTQSNAHPAFVEIIKGMSPLDVRIFTELVFKNNLAFSLPELRGKIHGEEKVLLNAFPRFYVPDLFSLGDPNSVSKSITNLCRLGVAQSSITRWKIGYDYEAHRTHEYLLNILEDTRVKFPNATSKIHISKGLVEVNDLGIALGKCCIG